MRVGDYRQAPTALPTGKRPGTHCVGGWVGHRAGLAPTGIQSPYRPARSESLYRLSYHSPHSLSVDNTTLFFPPVIIQNEVIIAARVVTSLQARWWGQQILFLCREFRTIRVPTQPPKIMPGFKPDREFDSSPLSSSQWSRLRISSTIVPFLRHVTWYKQELLDLLH